MKLHTISHKHIFINIVKIALFFGMIGDILLEIKGSEYYFQIGVGMFMIGHILNIGGYSKAFKLISKSNQNNNKLTILLTAIYFIFLSGATMTNLHFVYPYLSFIEKLGFSIYSFFLTIVSVTAFLFLVKSRNDPNINTHSMTIYFGSLLFWMSDNILAE